MRILTLLAVLAVMLLATPVMAVTSDPQICGTDAKIRAMIPGDRVTGWGITEKGKLITLTVSPSGGFAIIFRHPDGNGPTCFLATGHDWHEVKEKKK